MCRYVAHCWASSLRRQTPQGYAGPFPTIKRALKFKKQIVVVKNKPFITVCLADISVCLSVNAFRLDSKHLFQNVLLTTCEDFNTLYVVFALFLITI